MQTLPRLNAQYWVTLLLASVFGTNTGDFFAEGLNLGYFVGLPWIAAILALVFIAERFSVWRSAVFFWAAIITIRTGATNIGDIFHLYKIGFAISVPATLAVYMCCVWLYRRSWLASSTRAVSVGPTYWLTMIVAGILGTVGGDGASFGLRLTPSGTAIAFGTLALIAIVWWSRGGRISNPIPYWTTLALIRTCGTGGGDALAHALDLGTSTVVMGILFVSAVLGFYVIEKGNQVRAGGIDEQAAW